MFSAACAVFGLSGLATEVLSLFPGTSGLSELPAALGTLVTFPLTYCAVVRWSRHSAGVDPDDLLNGISSVLVVTALIGCCLAWNAPDNGEGLLLATVTWREQLLAAQSAVWIVVVTAALTAASVSRLYLDLRIWLVTGAYLMAGASGVFGLFADGSLPGWTLCVWCFGLLLLATAALKPVRFVPTQASDPVKSTVGAFVVVSAGMAVLVAALLTGVPALVALCAVAAVMGSSIRLLINLRELVQLAASRAEALTDDLTGGSNRRALLRRLESRVAQNRATQLAVFDLDHFKEVNDGLGHSVGDDLLRMVNQRVQSRLPVSALLGRLGGDEFAIVSPTGADGERALSLLSETFAEPFQLAGMSVHVDLSVGVTSWSPPEEIVTARRGEATMDAATLLRQADTAMYDAKRNDLLVVAYEPERHSDPRGLLAMVGELRRAITTGELKVHYQPQLHTGFQDDRTTPSGVVTGETRNGLLAGAEALVRWQHPRLGLLMPGQFLPLAESHGLMDAITREVLTQAVAQQSRWRSVGRDIRVSVNLSAGTLLDRSLPKTVEALLDEYQVPATSLVLEITETALLREPERSVSVVKALMVLGIQVSIDDFGTGYSSLTQLRQLPVSELKLDRSFTADLLVDPRAAAIVANTIALAHDLHLRVVAEGVEDEPTLAALAHLSCDETQGYLHSRPLPAADFDDWLRRYELVRVPGSCAVASELSI
ncbi:putative bifunctional diguanylate cyclase/phosphodiesterase [Kineosporia mesophila]|nr:bifunctional diguanylate cyclase/phosphodiesterase [Kineosporia mesophila]MCD5351229.1 bifunctional diguanylate cyclase/phosphodiesterase [Kineosporia mesophila]